MSIRPSHIILCLTLLLISSAVAVLIESNDTCADTNGGPERWEGFIENLGKDYDPTAMGGIWAGISSYDQLDNLRESSGINYYLKNNIIMSGEAFNPINDFSGIFDGNGYVISGLTIEVTETSGDVYAGLFSTVSENVEIRNLGLVDSSIAVRSDITVGVSEEIYAYAGGLIGCASDESTVIIFNSYNTGNVNADANTEETHVIVLAGGLIGFALSESVTISKSYNTGNVGADANTEEAHAIVFAGGLIASTSSGLVNISDSYNMGNLNVDADTNLAANVLIGGLVGYSSSEPVIISNSYNTGDMDEYVFIGEFISAGGIIGYAGDAKIINSYNVGNVTAEMITNQGTSPYGNIGAGGLIGYAGDAKIIKSYNAGNVSAEAYEDTEEAYAGGLVGVIGESIIVEHSYYFIGAANSIVGNRDDVDVASDDDSGGRTEKEMKTNYPKKHDIFVDWDFSETWRLDINGKVNDGYPYLSFMLNICGVILTSEGNGRLSPSGVKTVERGSPLTITFTPGEGSELKEVRVNGSLAKVSSNGRLSITITSDTRIHAVFSPQQTDEIFTVYVYGGDGGYAYGSGQFSKGEIAIIYAEPSSGYSFKQWSDGSNDKMRSITVTSDITLSASFSKDGSSPFGGSTMNGDNVWIFTLVLIGIIVAALIAVFMTRRGG